MATKPETAIATRIIKWIKIRGGDAWSVHGSALQRTGEPDIDGWLPKNWHLKLEVKTKTGKPSKIQIHRLRQYHRAGYIAGVVTSVENLEVLVYLYKLWHFTKYEDNCTFYQIIVDSGYQNIYGIYDEN